MESDWGGWAEWGPPITVLVAAIAFGWVSVVRMRPKADPWVESYSRKLDLEAAKDEAVAALKHLELDKDKLPRDEYERERERLLHRGARAMEALENPEAAIRLTPEPREVSQMPMPAERGSGGGLAPEWRGALYMLGALMLMFVLYNMAGNFTKPKEGGPMQMGSGGAADPGGAPGGQAASPRAQQVRDSPVFQQEVAAQEALLKTNPQDVAALNELTYLWLMMAEDPQKAFAYNEQALQANAKDPDARAFRAVLTAMMGMADKAVTLLDELLVDNPAHEKGTIYRAMILLQMGRTQEGIAALEAAAQANPASQELQMALAAARQMPPPPPGGQPPPAAAGEGLAAGTVTIDAASQAMLKGGEILFLSISNPAGGPGTPPVAAQKQPVGSFPVSFQLTTGDIRAMPGAGGVPDVFDVKARIDFDGNAMTKEAGPVAVVTGVRRGATGLTLNLTLDGAPAAAPTNSLLAPLPGAPAAPSGPVEVLASGTAQLDPSVQGITGNEIVFVSVRDPAGGPPLAVSRVPAKFPLQFRVTTADAIQMGAARPMPDTFNVSVRIDRDGNAMTKEGEPEVISQGVKKGTSTLQLTLK